jgi:acyl carrier protein
MNKHQNSKNNLQEVEQNIIQKIAFYCNLDITQINPLVPMEQIALDSILAMTIIEELQHQYEVDLPTFLFYENETIHDSANAILELMENARS